MCHASEDKPVVRRVVADLRRFGADVWIDESVLNAGDSLRESIERGIEKSDYALLFLSSVAVSKPWVNKELSAAFSLEIDRGRKFIIPVVVDDCQIPLLIRDKLYIDLRGEYKKGFDLLCRSLGLVDGDLYPESLVTESCDVLLDIAKPDGSLVHYRKTQTVRCIQGVSSGYEESFSPDGRIDRFRCVPGEVGRPYRESGHVFIPTYYGKTIHAGDTMRRIFECDWHDSFTEEKEYWEQRQHHPSSNVVVRIRFPKDRPPGTYWVEQRHGSVKKNTDLEPMTEVEEGRSTLSLTISEPVYLNSYLLRWEW